MRGFTVLATILGTLVAGLFLAVHVKADTPGCVSQFWMVGLRATTRTICDGPIQADGSWRRAREFYAPAFVAAGYSNCYGYGYCSFMPPREVAEYSRQEVYTVTVDTVLPDEPGHIA